AGTDGTDQLPATVGDVDAGADVCGECGTEHDHGDDGADVAGEDTEDDHDATDEFNGTDQWGHDAGSGDAQGGEESADALEAGDLELVPAVGDEDDTEEDAGQEKRKWLDC